LAKCITPADFDDVMRPDGVEKLKRYHIPIRRSAIDRSSVPSARERSSFLSLLDAHFFGCATAPLPTPSQKYDTFQYWAEHSDQDEGHRWLGNTVKRAAKSCNSCLLSLLATKSRCGLLILRLQ
jgi:hypothetical protein